MVLLLLAAVVVHLPLLLMKLPLKSYDANFHIFFASHYVQQWFDPWNSKWYAGFSQTTYPPLPQQWVALISPIFGLDMAYMAIQLAAIMLLVVGVYRFSLLWVSPRAASIAALASVFIGSESFLVYLFERPSISVRVGPTRKVAVLCESERALHCCGCSPPRNTSFWVNPVCSTCLGTCTA